MIAPASRRSCSEIHLAQFSEKADVKRPSSVFIAKGLFRFGSLADMSALCRERTFVTNAPGLVAHPPRASEIPTSLESGYNSRQLRGFIPRIH
jgi:hypothetical protein